MRLAAYQPDNPRNLGAMIRLCACFGVPLDVVEPCGFPFPLKALRQSALNYADIAEIRRHDGWTMFRSPLSGRLVLLITAAATPLWQASFQLSDTMFVGRESAGVPPEVHTAADLRVSVLMPGAAGR